MARKAMLDEDVQNRSECARLLITLFIDAGDFDTARSCLKKDGALAGAFRVDAERLALLAHVETVAGTATDVHRPTLFVRPRASRDRSDLLAFCFCEKAMDPVPRTCTGIFWRHMTTKTGSTGRSLFR